MNFLIRFIQHKKQPTRMRSLKQQQKILRSQSRSTKFSKNSVKQFSQLSGSTKKNSAFRSFLKKDGFAIVGILTICTLSGYNILFQSDQFTIHHVTVKDTQFVSKTDIENATLNSIHQPLFFLPKNNYWTIPVKRIEHALEEQFSQNFAVQGITVKKEYPNKLTITVLERVPSVTWITKEASGLEHYYTIDHEGIVTKETTIQNDIDVKLPKIIDKNREKLGIQWQVINSHYIDGILFLQKTLAESGWSVDSFVFPAMTCEEQEYVAQQIFADEIKDSESEKFKEKKRAIQEQFKKGELGIEESLEALENIKKEELAERDSSITQITTTPKKLQWATIDKTVECDYVRVASDLHVRAKKNSESLIELKFDTTRSLEEQLQQLSTFVNQGKIAPVTSIVDVRIKDRVYYK